VLSRGKQFAVCLVGVGIAFAHSMLTKLIMNAGKPFVTRIAMGMNTASQTLGSAVGKQVGTEQL